MSKIAECTKHWKDNSCESNDKPFFQSQCDKWYDCMMQNPESIMRVKVTAKQIAEIINEFSDAMNFKAWAGFFPRLLLTSMLIKTGFLLCHYHHLRIWK
jgi:hypothetical protein